MRKKNNRSKIMLALLTLVVLFMSAAPCFATEPTGTPSLDINLDLAEMFTWAETIVNVMMPIVYITMGIGLGFLIINALRRAFG